MTHYISGLLTALRWCPLWPKLFLFSLIIPTDFSFLIGTLRLTPYRVILIVGFFPSLRKFLSGQVGPVTIVDKLILLHIAWCFIVIMHHHGLGASIESGGIRMLEVGGTYLIARSSIVSEKTFYCTTAALFIIMCILAPLALFESVTGINIIRNISGLVTGNTVSSIGKRFGFYRSAGPFDHAILYGVFAASMLGIVWFRVLPKIELTISQRFPKYAVILGALSSLSSGALAALITQFILIVWEAKTRYIIPRWKILTALLISVYMAVELLSNRSGIKVFLHYLTFSAHTAYTRIIIFEWGIQDVWRNPVFGIGFNDWTRPSWMHSISMDNFWLVQAVTFGIPGFLTIALAVLLMLSRNWDGLTSSISKLRMGWTISMIGMIVAACTVHFWNQLFVYFVFFLGMGGWFLNLKKIHINSGVDNGV